MFWAQRLAVLTTAILSGAITFFTVDFNRPQLSEEFIDSDPSSDGLDNVRKAERSRRAIRPADSNRAYALGFDSVWTWHDREGNQPLSPRPAEAMPPTSCSSVERAESGSIHKEMVKLFVKQFGFGVERTGPPLVDNRGSLRRVELVSLLTALQPSVYVLDEMATPPLARRAERRPLDQFERLGLDAVRRGDEVVWSREAPKRMFGAIRAKTDCLRCHSKAKEGDLLGAFTYYLEVPVDQVGR